MLTVKPRIAETAEVQNKATGELTELNKSPNSDLKLVRFEGKNRYILDNSGNCYSRMETVVLL
jgi:hypothetical protein